MMTLPADCDTCGHPLRPWDDSEPTLCDYCESSVIPWEQLTLPERERREQLIARREAIANAPDIETKGGML